MSDPEQDDQKGEAPEAEQQAEGSSEALSQSEIERVLEDSQRAAKGTVYKAGGGSFGGDVALAPYDFYRPSFLSENELRKLGMQHEKFCHYLGARLSLFLRMDFKLKLNDVKSLSYKEYVESIASPANTIIFSVNSLTGVGLLDFQPRLGMAVVNRMLGGRGLSGEENRALTEIESGLLADFIDIMLNEWCGLWEGFGNLKAKREGYETDARFLQVASQDAILLVLELEATIADCSARVSFAFPDCMIEPIIRSIQGDKTKYSKIGTKEKKQRWRESYSEIDVPLYAEWKIPPMSVADILLLRPGDTLELSSHFIKNTNIRLMNTLCFKGEIGIDGEHVVVKLSNKVKQEN